MKFLIKQYQPNAKLQLYRKITNEKYAEKCILLGISKKNSKFKNMPAAELWAPGILLTFDFATNCS